MRVGPPSSMSSRRTDEVMISESILTKVSHLWWSVGIAKSISGVYLGVVVMEMVIGSSMGIYEPEVFQAVVTEGKEQWIT
jgi:hypothetical protein